MMDDNRIFIDESTLLYWWLSKDGDGNNILGIWLNELVEDTETLYFDFDDEGKVSEEDVLGFINSYFPEITQKDAEVAAEIIHDQS